MKEQVHQSPHLIFLGQGKITNELELTHCVHHWQRQAQISNKILENIMTVQVGTTVEQIDLSSE